MRFFPAAGRRDPSIGTSTLRGREAIYWSSSANSTANSYYFLFRLNDVALSQWYRTSANSIRCVAFGVRNYYCFTVLCIFGCSFR